MIVKTLFRQDSRFEPGEVEIKLLPGLPQLHIVGLPDASMRECGLRIKSALRSTRREWPRGHQIVVNLRPSHRRKQSSGVELAVALGFLALSGQLSESLRRVLAESVVYGEVGLDGRVLAPHDAAAAVRAVETLGTGHLLTGPAEDGVVPDGRWVELADLGTGEVKLRERRFDWQAHWRRPAWPDLELTEDAALALALTVHMRLGVLLAGPQGSGKTTWARLVAPLSPPPRPADLYELADIFGSDVREWRWLPCEQPHHATTPQALLGGGRPVKPGVISRAHGGVLIMDEFLQFHPQVLESLREPVERGMIEVARSGECRRLPARFQLLATTNLCPCGRLSPAVKTACTRPLTHCRSTSLRLSGPLMDRFDLLLPTHTWLARASSRVGIERVREWIERAAQCAAARAGGDGGQDPMASLRLPEHFDTLDLSHRRRQSLLRVARGLADLEGSARVTFRHFDRAADLVITPMVSLSQLFA